MLSIRDAVLSNEFIDEMTYFKVDVEKRCQG